MLLDLKKLFSGEDSRIPFSYSLDLSGTDINGFFPFVSPVRIEGEITANAGAPQLHADVSFRFSIPCDRCAVPVDWEYQYSFDHGLVASLNQEDNDFYIVVENQKLDLDELIRADILLELPTKYLCKPDCKGLCPQCGVNRNNESCTCKTRSIDPRLEVLKQLIDDEVHPTKI